jgi:hypothetical protein
MTRVGPQSHKKEKRTEREVRMIIGSQDLASLCNEIQELCKKNASCNGVIIYDTDTTRVYTAVG